MYKARGIMLRIGDDDNFLFHNRTRIHGMGSKWGISIALRWGMAYFPFSWKTLFTTNDAMHNYNGQRVYKFPIIFPFVSVMLGKYGFYGGFKMIHWHPDYADWVKPEDRYKWDDGTQDTFPYYIKGEATCLHPTLRGTRHGGA